VGRRIAADEENYWDDYDPEDEPADEDDTIPCPYCRRLIHEDAQRCPYCENYMSSEDAPAAAKPMWIIVGFLLCFLVVVLWILGR
jgi:uncharacterized paraquat-inducible protein A